MIRLRKSKFNELPEFHSMESQEHAKSYINQTALEIHQSNFYDSNIVYLSIENELSELVGYFILVLEPNNSEVEFRRIVIDEKHRGVGQQAITAMEEYCKTELQRTKIWLDVYEDNHKGKHIYEKLGYSKFKEQQIGGRKLLLYDKCL